MRLVQIAFIWQTSARVESIRFLVGSDRVAVFIQHAIRIGKTIPCDGFVTVRFEQVNALEVERHAVTHSAVGGMSETQVAVRPGKGAIEFNGLEERINGILISRGVEVHETKIVPQGTVL